jgi:glycosyltransferase involved in cell wall biosynthesis
MKIGILGTRGIPNAYGGFEQFAQYLAQGLKRKGHDVWVYNSSDHPFQQNEWNGIHIIHCKDLESSIGTAGQFVYDFNCIRDARTRGYDILLHLGYTSNSIWYRWWPGNCPNIVNMDGLEWKRSKYNKWTQRFLKRAEFWAAENGDTLIADSIGIQEHLSKEYNKPSIYIPYGADIFENIDASVLSVFDLEPRSYFLLIARMEPENNIELILQGYLQSSQPFPLILIGSVKNKFGKYLSEKYSQDNIRFLGGIYESRLINNLRYFSNLYFHGHSVGGTNPSLLEAMGCQCNIASHENPFNTSILTNAAYYFSKPEDIVNIINQPADQSTIEDRKKSNLEKIQQFYNWPKIIEDYEKTFFDSCLVAKS